MQWGSCGEKSVKRDNDICIWKDFLHKHQLKPSSSRMPTIQTWYFLTFSSCICKFCPKGGTPRKIGWGCAACFPKPLSYLQTIIEGGFWNIQNNQGRGKGYQPRTKDDADNPYNIIVHSILTNVRLFMEACNRFFSLHTCCCSS